MHNNRDAGGFTPLINAAWHGDHKICTYLLQHGADPSAVGSAANAGSLVTKANIIGPMNAAEWAHWQKHPKLAALLEASATATATASSRKPARRNRMPQQSAGDAEESPVEESDKDQDEDDVTEEPAPALVRKDANMQRERTLEH